MSVSDCADPLFEQRHDQVWESHVAAEVWGELLDDTPGVTVLRSAVPVGVTMDGRSISGVGVVAGKRPQRKCREHNRAAERHQGKAGHRCELRRRRDVLVRRTLSHRTRGTIVARAARGQESIQATWSPRREAICRTPSCRAAPVRATAASWRSPAASTAASTMIRRRTRRTGWRTPPPGYDPKNYSWEPVGKKSRWITCLFQHHLRPGERQVFC